MIKKLIIGMFIIILLIISGCTNKELDIFNKEKEQLTNEILELEKLMSRRDEEISRLEKVNSDQRDKLRELTESLEMVRASSYARLNDYNDTFDNLKNIYRINSEHVIKDDWYVINNDYFQIELLGYENAEKVDFYTQRWESDQGPLLVFTDTNPVDGWVYTNDNISEIINKQIRPFSGGFSYVPYFLIYTEVTLEGGKIIRTSKLPIYNK